jgi:hypothetical protein
MHSDKTETLEWNMQINIHHHLNYFDKTIFCVAQSIIITRQKRQNKFDAVRTGKEINLASYQMEIIRKNN